MTNEPYDDTLDGRKFLNGDRQAQQLLRQFLNTDGPKANSKAYNRGYEFTFEFSDADRSDVNYLMESMHMTFVEAFDAFKEYKRNFPQTIEDSRAQERVEVVKFDKITKEKK